ncbi:hypothetical protein HDR63_00660 [bacterium]|nr:hypothetical protein [bacterium]
MEWTKTSAEQRIAALGMDDMPLMEFTPISAPVAADWFPKYRAARRAFIQSLTDSIEEIAFLGLSQTEFTDLLMGRRMPVNLCVRTRVPITWGGAIDPSNMFMCRTFPHSHNMDRFIIEQNGAKQIWLPNPVKKIYVPAHTASGGTGGNATEDRLAQMAAQIASSRGME